MQVTTIKGQSLRDIAAEYYGDTSQPVIDELITLNGELLKNDFQNYGYIDEITYFYIDIPIIESTVLEVDETSNLRNLAALSNMKGETIITG